MAVTNRHSTENRYLVDLEKRKFKGKRAVRKTKKKKLEYFLRVPTCFCVANKERESFFNLKTS